MIKAVIGAHQNVKNNGISRADSMLMRKGGVAGGVKNAESSGNTRFKVVKPGQFGVAFWSQIVRVWARLSAFSSNPCAKVVQNDHIDSRGVAVAC